MRLYYLFKKDLYESRKTLITYAITIFVVMFLPSAVASFLNRGFSLNEGFSYGPYYVGFLMLGGAIISSIAFTDSMYGKTTQHDWLMLPATATERLSVKLLISILIYPVMITLYIFVSSAVIEGFNLLIFRVHSPIFNPLSSVYFKLLLHNIILQSLFLMGSTYFRKAAFIKTVLSMGIFAMVLGIITSGIGYLLFKDVIDTVGALNADVELNNFVMHYGTQDAVMDFRFFEYVGKIIYWILLSPFCWLVSYFRIREVQANDTV